MNEISTFKPKLNKKFKPLYSSLFPPKSSSPLKNNSPIIEESDEENIKNETKIVNKFQLFKDKVSIRIEHDIIHKCDIILYTFNGEFEVNYLDNLNDLNTIDFKNCIYVGIINNKTNQINYYNKIDDFIRDYIVYFMY